MASKGWKLIVGVPMQLLSGVRGRVLLFCWLGWVLDLYDLVLFSYLRGEIAKDLGVDTVEIGTVLGVQMLATAVGGIAFGRLADRMGRGLALSWSIALFSLGTLWTGMVDGVVGLYAARILTGLGAGGEWGVGHAWVAETFPKELRGRASGILQAGSPVGVALAGVVGTVGAAAIGWRDCFLWSALGGMVAFGGRLMLPKGTGAIRDLARASFVDLFRGPLLRPSLVLLGVFVLQFSVYYSVYQWLPGELKRKHSPGSIAELQLWISGVHLFADLAFGWCADRFGRVRSFVATSMLFAIGLFVVGALFDSLVDDLFGFGLIFVPLGLGMGTWGCFGVLCAEQYPRQLRATAASTFYNFARGAQFLVQPTVGATLAAQGSLAFAFTWGAVGTLLAAFVLLALPRTKVSS